MEFPTTCRFAADASKNDFVQCPLENFCKHYLPAPPAECDVVAAVKKLKAAGYLVGPTEELHWAHFYLPPAKRDSTESAACLPLNDICSALGSGKVVGQESRCHLAQLPNRSTKPGHPGSRHKVDGFLKMMDSTVVDYAEDAPSTSDIVASCKFELSENDRLDVRYELPHNTVLLNHSTFIFLESLQVSRRYSTVHEQ